MIITEEIHQFLEKLRKCEDIVLLLALKTIYKEGYLSCNENMPISEFEEDLDYWMTDLRYLIHK